MEELPSHIMTVIGKSMDFTTRRNCILAHKSFAPIMYSYTVEAWDAPFALFENKIKALLKYKPLLNVIYIRINDNFDVDSFMSALHFFPLSVQLCFICACDTRTILLLRALKTRCRNNVFLRGTLQSFSTFLDVLELCTNGWLSVETICIQNYIVLNDKDEERVVALLKSWHEQPWKINSIDFKPEHLYDAYLYETPIIHKQNVAQSVRDLFSCCCNNISLQISRNPTLLSCVANHINNSRSFLNNSTELIPFLEDLASNPNLKTLVVQNVDHSIFFKYKPLFERVMKNGRVWLYLGGDAIVFPALATFCRVNNFPIVLNVHNKVTTYLARKVVEELAHTRRITITYFEGTLAFKIMPLKELAALIVAEEDPAFCAYYNIP